MTEIQLYNTRTRRKERFEPLIPGQVRMYVCGPTVYDRAHIGNARPVVVFDVLYRLLRHVYGEDAVSYVRNFTDVDDKIIARAQETKAEGETLEAACRRITEETIRWYHEDMDAIGALRPDHEPRCTEYIPQMVAMIERLIAEGCAYAAEGHVLFDVTKYAEYGRLSRRSLEDMQAGARVEVAPYKKNPMDFVLWKPSTPEQPGWESPWGRGRPGWHIECSAMAQALLGETFDIHGGGIDLLFPHHENEVAQSCCANHTEVMANFWMHNGFLQVEGEKMAKSLGNFFTVRDLIQKFHPRVIRYGLLSTHYRQPLDWREDKLFHLRNEIFDWVVLFEGLDKLPDVEPCPEVIDSLADDLNFAQVQKHLRSLTTGRTADTIRLRSNCRFLGLWDGESKSDISYVFVGSAGFDVPVGRIDGILRRITVARAKKDYDTSDRLRAALTEAGLKVKISASGEVWYEETPDFDPAKLPVIDDD